MTHGSADLISGVYPDIIGTHILTRLDGVSLASFTSASSHFRSVAASDEQQLWRHACTSTWPSTSDPRVQHLIESLPTLHRGFFAGSFPLLTGHVTSNPNRPSQKPLTKSLISAVDIRYKNEPVFSRIQETETVSDWFEHSPFRVDLLDPKESFRVPATDPEVAESLEVSWIMIDPTRKVWANISSLRAVAKERHWLTGEISVKYSTVVGKERVVEVEVKVGVTCRGEVHVREVGMRVEDLEGKWMNGRDSLGVLEELMEFGVRSVGRNGRVRVRYEDYLERKRVWRDEKERREMRMGIACLVVGVLVFAGFCILCFERMHFVFAMSNS